MSERIKIDLNAIKRAAMAATPGIWTTDDPHQVWSDSLGDYVAVTIWGDPFNQSVAESNANHIAAMNPAVVLELVRRLEEAEKDAAKWREREAKIADLRARGLLGSPLRAATGEPK